MTANAFTEDIEKAQLAGMDGIRVTAAIRASGKEDTKTIPIIEVSAKGFAYDIKKAREAGLDEYVTKPIDRDSLMSLHAGLLERSCYNVH